MSAVSQSWQAAVVGQPGQRGPLLVGNPTSRHLQFNIVAVTSAWFSIDAHVSGWSVVLIGCRWRCRAPDCLCRRVAEDSIKNYQLWNHRRKIALALGPEAAAQELQFCAGG